MDSSLNDAMPEMLWIMDHEEFVYAPGVLIKDFSETIMHVQCIIDEEYYEIDKPAYKVPLATFDSVEDLCDLEE